MEYLNKVQIKLTTKSSVLKFKVMINYRIYLNDSSTRSSYSLEPLHFLSIKKYRYVISDHDVYL